MAKRNPEASVLRQTAVAGVLYLAVAAALAGAGFFTPHSVAREATLAAQAHSGDPLKVLVVDAHSVLITGHAALSGGLHLAMLAVHECFSAISSVFGL